MHNVGRGALDIWLRLLLRDALVDQTAGRDTIERIHMDLRFVQFNVNLPASFNASGVSPG